MPKQSLIQGYEDILIDCKVSQPGPIVSSVRAPHQSSRIRQILMIQVHCLHWLANLTCSSATLEIRFQFLDNKAWLWGSTRASSEGRESRSRLGLETEGTETLGLVSVSYKILELVSSRSRLG